MNSSSTYDLSHICFAGKPPTRAKRSAARRASIAALAASPAAPQERLDAFIAWVLGCAGLDAAAYRPQPLERRLPACLRTLKVGSPQAARELLGRKPHLVAKAVSSLLIGVTEFFREPDVFDFLSAQVLPALAGNRRLRIWSAACSTGAELYSMAMHLSEAGLLERSHLLGTDCRGDAIERARLGYYDAAMLEPVRGATRDKFFEPAGPPQPRNRRRAPGLHGWCTDPAHGVCGLQWRPVEALRRQVHWKVADLLAGVEEGPWDIILWRNTALYLRASAVETVWRRLVSVLAPQGVMIAGKADRPPRNAGLTQIARFIYRRSP